MVTTYKIKPNLSVLEFSNGTWKKSLTEFPNAIEVIELFKKHNNLQLIQDPKDKEFLKNRINILPDGQVLNQYYSLFSPDLKIHDEKSHSHWDVIYKNPSGSYAYLYTLEKGKLSKESKYKKVSEFAKCLPRLKKNLMNVLREDSLALPMLILLKTKMRVGNEIYYNKNQHKGLTTLKKNNIKVYGNKVTFDYIAKDGVPQKTTETFSNEIINQLKQILKSKSKNDFIFTNLSGHPLKDTEFEKAFERYCGKKFYPHIVRSHYATEEANKFIKKNKHPSKQEVKKLYIKIAEKLGHKKFSKKSGNWEDSYQ
ncbi:MAG: hypothetical protein NUV97_03165, partial [archaeon]|nr:hypothetical protein [archaeon]